MEGEGLFLSRSLTEIRIIKSNKKSWTCMSFCNKRIIIALKTYPAQMCLCWTLNKCIICPWYFHLLPKTLTEVAGTVRMGLILRWTEQTCARLAVCLSELACFHLDRWVVVISACFYMDPCEKWLVVAGVTSIVHHLLRKSHIYCSYLQQGRKKDTRFLPK